MNVSKADEDGFDGGFIFILLLFHTREGTGGKDAIHFELVNLYFIDLSF